MANTAHRSGALKQSNKNHKTGKHRSKGAVDAVNRYSYSRKYDFSSLMLWKDKTQEPI